ncbi:hypothetical protein EDD16DRAFT_1783826 [Pisolithus croceorrhizus]|nr:hypothetical protein EDD16DRAFT_1783826 [Pisolithus croceorrhizus]
MCSGLSSSRGTSNERITHACYNSGILHYFLGEFERVFSGRSGMAQRTARTHPQCTRNRSISCGNGPSTSLKMEYDAIPPVGIGISVGNTMPSFAMLNIYARGCRGQGLTSTARQLVKEAHAQLSSLPRYLVPLFLMKQSALLGLLHMIALISKDNNFVNTELRVCCTPSMLFVLELVARRLFLSLSYASEQSCPSKRPENLFRRTSSSGRATR